jgi:CRISPR-associated protein Csx10
MNLYLDVTLQSDTCLGAAQAAGAGDVDTTVERDRDGFPVARGRTIKGLLAEEADALCSALSRSDLKAASIALFGEPKAFSNRAAVSFRDGGVVPALRASVRAAGWGPERIERAFTVVRRQTAIDAETGAADAATLRATRLVRAGQVLRFPVSLHRELTDVEKGLLAAAVASVRRVGLHRNEGWGRVRARLRTADGIDQTGAWLLLLDAAEAPAVDVVQEAPPAPADPSGVARVVQLDLDLTHPVLLAEREGAGWAVRGLDYLTGSAVRGAAIARYLAECPSADAAGDSQFRRWFLDGGCRWLNGTATLDGKRYLPTPLSFRQPKHADDEVLDRAAIDASKVEGKRAAEGWKAVDRPFFALGEPESEQVTVNLTAPGRVVRMHHQRDRVAGRPVDGGIYQYDGLASGQRMRAFICCEHGADATALAAWLNGVELSLGRARTAGYGGGVRVSASVIEGAPHFEQGSRPETDDRLVLTLLSDHLGAAEDGTPDPASLESDLASALRLDLEALRRDGRVSSYRASRLVNGQVGTWRMPRPAWPASVAGSVVVFEGVKPAPDDVDNLMWRGIGQRRAEGFGRVAVNLHGDEVLVSRRNADGATALAARPPTLPGDPDHWPKLRTELFRALAVECAIELGFRHGREPALCGVRPALVARLRQRVRTATTLDAFTTFVKSLGDKQAGKALRRVWYDNQTLSSWLASNLSSWRALLKPHLNGVDLDHLPDDQAWPIQQAYLDAMTAAWRQRAAKEKP